jgi:hypothetical protein
MDRIDALTIQKYTYEYFTGSPLVNRNNDNNHVDVDDRLRHEIWDEQDLRIRTGGTLFAIEEGDVVRSMLSGPLGSI